MIFKALATAAALGWLLAFSSCSPAPCGPSNCKGCCDPEIGRCRDPGNTTGSCGAKGLVCQSCGSGEKCTDGACVNPNPAGVGGGAGGGTGGSAGGGMGGGAGGGAGGGGGGVKMDAGLPYGCGPGTASACTDGCCNGTGISAICLSGTSLSSCGLDAGACVACNVASGQKCMDRVCSGTNPPYDAGADLYGSPCTKDADCGALGGKFTCKLATSSDNAPYPGGYCTEKCGSPGDCSNTLSACITVQPQYGEADAICWNRCSPTRPCRTPGYSCYNLGGGTSACWLAPLPTLDAGRPADKTGNACVAKADCTNPPDDGFCRPEFLADGGPTGLPGGACSSNCRIDKKHCGDGGVCVDYQCEAACPGPLAGQGSCRAGWVCGPTFGADAGQVDGGGKCQGNCNNLGFACPTGYTCGLDDAGVGEAGYCCNGTRCL